MLTRIAKRAAVALLITAAAGPVSRGDDWPQWRGPKRDGVASDFKAPKSWPEKLRLEWKVRVGYGAASPVMAGDRVYLFTNQGRGEVVTALSLRDGKQVWQVPAVRVDQPVDPLDPDGSVPLGLDGHRRRVVQQQWILAAGAIDRAVPPDPSRRKAGRKDLLRELPHRDLVIVDRLAALEPDRPSLGHHRRDHHAGHRRRL